MILPIHRRRPHAAWPRPSAASTTSPPTIRCSPRLPVEIPPRRALGDLAVPLAFELARRLRKAPRAIAQEIAAALGPIDGFSRIEAAPNGYVNFFLDRPAQFVAGWLRRRRRRRRRPTAGKTIVEHTAINPNKAAHIGHLRNAALGDAFGRLLRFLGRDGRDSELHRRHRRPGRRRRRRLPRARAQDARRGPRDRRHARGSTTTAGISTPASPSGTRKTRTRLKIRTRGAARHRARRQRHRRPRRVHRRSHRPLPPGDDARG